MTYHNQVSSSIKPKKVYQTVSNKKISSTEKFKFVINVKIVIEIHHPEITNVFEQQIAYFQYIQEMFSNLVSTLYTNINLMLLHQYQSQASVQANKIYFIKYHTKCQI